MENLSKTKKRAVIFFIAILIVAFAACCISLNLGDNGIADAAVLKQGSTGSQVRDLQTRLRDWGYMNGSVDGIFGSKTRNAVIYFQRKHYLTQDGIVGANTAAKLGMVLTGSSSGNSGYSSSNVYLLAKLVHAEARGEPYTGKVAVAAIVLNRVKDSRFPNTISGVVYEPWAFTCVQDGQINLEPDSNSKKAAQDAMNGWDPTSGCIYYYNPSTATSKWIWSRPIMLKIGNHNFTT